MTHGSGSQTELRELLEALTLAPSDRGNATGASLEEIRTALMLLSPGALRDLVPGLSFSGLFKYLHTDDSERVRVCCEVLRKLLLALDPSAVLPTFHADLLLGLDHWADDVKALCLSQVLKASCLLQVARAVEVSPQQVAQHVDVVTATVRLLSSDSLEIAQQVSRICVLIGRSADGLDLLLRNNRVLPELVALTDRGDVIRYRVYEVVVDLSAQSPSALEQAVASGLLPRLLAELSREDDVLVRLNGLELVTTLAQTTHGLTYLDAQGSLSQLERALRDVDADPLAALVLPGIIKFFGSVCRVQPQEISMRFRPFFSLLFAAMAEGAGGSLANIATETLGIVGRSAEGKQALEKLGEPMREGCGQLGRFIVNAPTALRVSSLEAVGSLMHLPMPDQTPALLALTELWFTLLAPPPGGDSPLRPLLSIAQQPFSDLRLAALSAVRSLAALPWAQRRLHAHAGFDEYALDRGTEHSKEGLEAKHAIVVALAGAPGVEEVFGAAYVARLREYVREGAFCVRRETQVAMDNAD